MKILQLELQNIMGYDQVSMKFDEPVNVIFGADGAGKTIIFDAIYWALTGVCEHRDIRRKNQGSMVATDPNTVHGVHLWTDGQDTQLERKQTGDGKQTGFGALPLIPELIRPSILRTMTPKARQQLFQRCCGLDDDALETEMSKYPINDTAKDKIRADIDAAEKWAREERTAWGRIMRTELTPPTVTTYTAVVNGEQIERPLHNVGLTDLQNKQAGLAEKIAAVEYDIKLHEEGDSTEALEQRVAELKRLLEACDVKRLKGVLEEIRIEKIQANDRMQQKLGEYNGAVAFRDDICKEMDKAKKSRKKEVEGPCGFIHARDAMIEHMEARFQKSSQKVSQKKNEFDQSGREYNDMVERYENVQKELEIAAEKAKEIEQRISDNQGVINQRNMTQPLDDLKALLAERNEALEALNGYIQAVEAYREECKNYENCKQASQEAETHHKTFELIVSLVGEGGALRNVACCGARTLQIDADLAAAWGMESLDIIPDGSILLYGRPYAMASESEKWRVECLAALALTQAAGIGVVFLDGVNLLTDTRDALQRRANELTQNGTFEQIIMNCSVNIIPVSAPPAGWAYWHVKNGEVRRL